MRFLPTIEVRNQIIQLEFPDVHAIALAESCLISDKAIRLQALQKLMLDSPMLLYWIFQHWYFQHSQEQNFPISDCEFESNITHILDLNSRNLVRDHAKPLSSVQRIEAHLFSEFQQFFAIRNKENQDSIIRLLERVAVLNHLTEHLVSNNESLDQRQSELTDSFRLETHVRSELSSESIVKRFMETDFQHAAGNAEVTSNWDMDLPFFRTGFDELESKLDRLEQLEKQFKEEVERAKVGAVQQLAYGASHEVNNPLANISTRAQALLRDETDPKRRQRLMTIDAQAFRAHDMISNLMTFAKPRSPQFERIQLHPVASRSIGSLESLAKDNEIVIENQIEHSVYLDADPEQVQEIIFSLVQNAIEAIRSSGTIKVRSSHKGNQDPVLIEVLDTGPGISPEVRRHIFDPFFSGREAGRGLGFGMPKVWRLMELHGGTVRITEKNENTCVELVFPYQQTAVSERTSQVEKTA